MAYYDEEYEEVEKERKRVAKRRKDKEDKQANLYAVVLLQLSSAPIVKQMDFCINYAQIDKFDTDEQIKFLEKTYQDS